ncbi:hypothetical protein KC19_VG326800 [Ceratodon purpureus]|uniref:Secreted protein n=1 Tax=Ceratodon purpureus TaxID=3225 RepID=A0A8T0HX06_CERPU|nr:hypothetical protein KC19_VG326800 [Ceratodon purpureus]
MLVKFVQILFRITLRLCTLIAQLLVLVEGVLNETCHVEICVRCSSCFLEHSGPTEPPILILDVSVPFVIGRVRSNSVANHKNHFLL